MKLIPFVFALLLYSCNFAHAQETKDGIGPLCDTAEQMKQVIADGNFTKVNQQETVCGVMHVVYIKGNQVGTVEYNNKVYAITEITVVGVYDPEGGLHPMPPFTQYTLFKTNDTAI